VPVLERRARTIELAAVQALIWAKLAPVLSESLHELHRNHVDFIADRVVLGRVPEC